MAARVAELTVDPQSPRASPQRGRRTCGAATARVNAEVVRRLLAGDQGPVRDAVLLNASAALVALGGSTPTTDADLVERLAEARIVAAAAVDSGAAAAALDRWVAATRSRTA